jgi:glycyl-tRNA synthetase beta chain
VVPGATLAVGLQKALDEAIAKLPIPKVMQYQLETGEGSRRLPAGLDQRELRAPGARPGGAARRRRGAGARRSAWWPGRTTQGHRFEAACRPVVTLRDADSYAASCATKAP